jgi:hypothetical protein
MLVFPVSAQEENTLHKIEGTLIAEEGSVMAVHVLNISSFRATTTDAEGKFAIGAKRSDTLMFSAVHFKRKEVIVTSEILQQGHIAVTMETGITQLDEVVLLPYNLSGNIGRDAEQVFQGDAVSASTLGLPNANAWVPTQSERRLHEAGGGFLSPTNWINSVSGRKKRLKTLVRLERNISLWEKVRHAFPDSVYSKELGLPKNRLDDFVYYCETDPSFGAIAKGADPLRIWDFVVLKSKGYKKLNNIEP